MSRTEVKPIDVFRTMQAAEPGARLVSLIPHDQYASIPADLDEDIRPLLTLGAGLRFTRSHGMEVRWDGGLSSISADDAFPRSMCLAENGFGDGWNVDINPTTGRWGPVYFVGHDPPVIVLQAGHFVDFLLQLAGEGPEPPSSLSRVLGGVFDIATSGGAAVPL